VKNPIRPAMWNSIGTRFLPFADAASADLPLGRILRLSLFQVSVGLSAVLLTGTLNRVMIVELKVPSALVAIMVSLPLLFAPLRALIGHKSDTHKSVLGWRRVPYIWFGTMTQFGGFAILPFALLLMTGQGRLGGPLLGELSAAFAFLLIGAGMHTTQTAGLALATDLASKEKAPRVVALLYVMQLIGIMVSALVIGRLLADFSPTRLVQVVQGTAVLTVILNTVALWKQEARAPRGTHADPEQGDFAAVWNAFVSQPNTRRLLVATGLGAAAFAMQDVLLEPYGGQVLGLSVGATTMLTALWALGTLTGFGFAARALSGGYDPHRIAGNGGVAGIAAFLMIIFASPSQSVGLLCLGATTMGLGGGLFAVGTMTAAMALVRDGRSGLALGAWGAVQATCAGLAIAAGGIVRDIIATRDGAIAGYTAVYLTEIILLLGLLIAIGPLVGRAARMTRTPSQTPFGLTEFPT
jgi:MFS transporter, BCD family, chlorophyll transporter